MQMALSKKAAVLYRVPVAHVRTDPGKVITYGQIERSTGIEAISQTYPLGEIHDACDAHNPPLPPLTAIVVQSGSAYDDDRHGQVGPGYWEADARNQNRRRLDRSPDLKKRLERHQDDVHIFSGPWPERL